MPWGEPPVDDGEQQARGRVTDRLQVQLPVIVARQVPVRGITAGPVEGVARLRLADGTTMLVGARQPGDLGRVVRAVADKRAVLLTGWDRGPQGLAITLGGVPGRTPVSLRVLGPDQPD